MTNDTSHDRAPDANASLCTPFLASLPIDGVSISVFGVDGGQSTVCASGAVAAQVEQAQFELGEGPHWEVLRTGEPVLVPDVRQAGPSRWPMFSAAIDDSGVGALFAIPLIMGTVTLGVACLYRTVAGGLAQSDVSRALSLAAATVVPAVRIAIRDAGEDGFINQGLAPEMRREVLQATGMIVVQLDITATEAFSRLRAHAFAAGRDVEDVAADVVSRRCDFRDLDR